MIALALVLLGIHAGGLLADIRLIVFASGLPLTFYVPGALLVWAASPGPFVRLAGPVERLGLSVVCSVATIAVLALVLDLTPVGITAASLTVSIGVLIPVAVILRWAIGRSASR